MNLRLRTRILNIYWYSMKILIYTHIIICNFIGKIYIVFNYFKKSIYCSHYNFIYIVNNNSIIHSYKLIEDLEPYDYLVYKKQNEDKMHMILTTNVSHIKQLMNNTINLQLCSFEFISVLIKSNEQVYDISSILKNNNHYYYIIGAKLFDKNFIKWICLYHLKVNLDNPIIVFMDNNIKQITITTSQYINLNKDSYEILTN